LKRVLLGDSAYHIAQRFQQLPTATGRVEVEVEVGGHFVGRGRELLD